MRKLKLWNNVHETEYTTHRTVWCCTMISVEIIYSTAFKGTVQTFNTIAQ